MALTAQEQARIRDYLGYLNLNAIQSIQLGFPAASQALFLVDSAMTRVRPEAETEIVRKLLIELDRLDAEMAAGRKFLKVRQVGDITLNPDRHLPDLRREQKYWAQRMADALGVPLNSYALRWSDAGFSMRVEHGL